MKLVLYWLEQLVVFPNGSWAQGVDTAPKGRTVMMELWNR